MKISLIMGIFLVFPSIANANLAKGVNEARQLYEQGSFEKSAEKFKEALEEDVNSSILNYNYGTALYKNKEYEDALQYLRQSLVDGNVDLKKKAYFNIGNSLYKVGLSKEEEDIDGAIKSMEQALVEYEKLIFSKEMDEEAKENHEFVRGEIERLKQKKEQEQNQKQSNEQDNQDSQEKEQQEENKQENSEKEDQDNSSEEKEEQDNSNEKSEEEQQNQRNQQDQQEQNAQEQEGEEEPSEEQPNQSTSSGGDEGDDFGPNPQSKPMTPEEISEQQAQMLIDQYQQQEEPQGILNLIPQDFRIRQVEKDW